MVLLASYHTSLAFRDVGSQHSAITMLSHLLTHSISTTTLSFIRRGPFELVPCVLQYDPGHSMTSFPVGGSSGSWSICLEHTPVVSIVGSHRCHRQCRLGAGVCRKMGLDMIGIASLIGMLN